MRLIIWIVISAGVFIATDFVYADPIASTFVGLMILATSYPLVARSGRYLLERAPDSIDIKGVREDVERITGQDTVHELHVWNLSKQHVRVYFVVRCS
jgi:Co/Zn/Cd efflux system component